MVDELSRALAAFVSHLEDEQRVSEATITAYRADLWHIFAAARARGRTTLAALDVELLRALLDRLTDRRGRPLHPRSIGRKHSALRGFFAWICAHFDPSLRDPTPYLISPPQPRGPPRPLEVPAALALMQGRAEVEDEPTTEARSGPAQAAKAAAGAEGQATAATERRRMSPERAAAANLRDVAALLLMYGPGLRRQEVLELRLADVDLDGRWLRVRGRGRRDRSVPIPTGCIEGLRAYVVGRDAPANPYFLPGRHGAPLAPRTLASIVSRAAVQLVGQHATPKQLRHSFATHLLEHGASLQHIQQMLGHSQIATTMRYKECSREKLALAYALAHPRAREGHPTD